MRSFPVWAIGGFLLLSTMSFRDSQSSLTTSTSNVLTIRSATVKVEIASTPEQRVKGLSGRTSLAENAGLLFLFEKSNSPTFWMKDMRFPIDIIWIRDGAVVDIDANVPAPQPGENPAARTSPEPVDAVLELPAGAAAEQKIHVGDPVMVQN
jgi:hypothetical protein